MPRPEPGLNSAEVMETLTYDEIFAIHKRVCIELAPDDEDPAIPGCRDNGRLLESVVHRQHVGIADTLKYPDPLTNAASLTFGICCGHPFHNANKRTALVSMLAHLERNQLTIFGVRKRELYNMIKQVANHEFGARHPPRGRSRTYTERGADDEVMAIASWLGRYARKFRRGEHTVTYKQLRRLLAARGLVMANPNNNAIGVYRQVEVRRGLFKNKKRDELKHIATISYPGENKVVGVRAIKEVRRKCQLDEAHGVDSTAFYDGADVVDVFINEYRDILSKLARQ